MPRFRNQPKYRVTATYKAVVTITNAYSDEDFLCLILKDRKDKEHEFRLLLERESTGNRIREVASVAGIENIEPMVRDICCADEIGSRKRSREMLKRFIGLRVVSIHENRRLSAGFGLVVLAGFRPIAPDAGEIEGVVPPCSI